MKNSKETPDKIDVAKAVILEHTDFLEKITIMFEDDMLGHFKDAVRYGKGHGMCSIGFSWHKVILGVYVPFSLYKDQENSSSAMRPVRSRNILSTARALEKDFHIKKKIFIKKIIDDVVERLTSDESIKVISGISSETDIMDIIYNDRKEAWLSWKPQQ